MIYAYGHHMHLAYSQTLRKLHFMCFMKTLNVNRPLSRGLGADTAPLVDV